MRPLLQRSKDAALAFAARAAANNKLHGIGEVTELTINTKNKKARVRLQLVGEAEPVEIEVTKYSLDNVGPGLRLTIDDATASRPWIAVVLREFVIGKSFPVPRKVETMLKFVGLVS